MPPMLFEKLVEWGPPYVALGCLLWGIWKGTKWLGAILFAPAKNGDAGGIVTRHQAQQAAFLQAQTIAVENLGRMMGEQGQSIKVVERRLTEILTSNTDPDEMNHLVEILLEQLPIPLSQSSEEGFFLRTNRSFRDLVGYTEEELAGLKFDDLTPTLGDRAADLENCRKIIKGSLKTFRMEKTYRRKDRSEVYCALYVFRFPQTGAFRFFVACVLPLHPPYHLR